jgi:hypothetical protein
LAARPSGEARAAARSQVRALCFQQFLSRAGNGRKAHSHQRTDEKHPHSGSGPDSRFYLYITFTRTALRYASGESGGEIVSLVPRDGTREGTLANGVRDLRAGDQPFLGVTASVKNTVGKRRTGCAQQDEKVASPEEDVQ